MQKRGLDLSENVEFLVSIDSRVFRLDKAKVRMKISVWCRTDKGLRRESNQDSYLINNDLGLFIVADGMGGHSGGEVASALAVETVEQFVKSNRNSDLSARDLIARAYEEASHRIYDKSAVDPKLTGMGTTMVLAYYDGDSVFIANVGDSRAYLFREPHLWQVTEDHSLVNEQLRAGIINEDQVKSFANRNVITRSVGFERDVVVDILERPVQSGDRILLCSDGLSGMVADVMLSEILTRTKEERVTEVCVEQALAHGGDDNVTVLYLEID